MDKNRFALLIMAVTFAFFPVSNVSAQSQLEAVKSRGEIVAGVRFDSPPFGFVDANGKNVGIDVQIAQDFARRLGLKLQLVQVTAQSRIPMLSSGKVDLLVAALTHTREREKAIDFSITYFHDAIKMLVKKGSGISGPEDLRGKAFSMVQGSTVVAAARKSIPSDVRVLQFQENPQAFLALRQGLAAAFLSDVLTLDQFIKSDPNFEIVGPEMSLEPIAIGMRKNDSEWRNAINGMLQDMVVDGSWERIIKQFVGVSVTKPELWP